MQNFENRQAKRLQHIAQQGRFRKVIPVAEREQNRITIDERDYLNLSGNDYLGLASSRDLVCEFYTQLSSENCLELYGPGSGASRLMTGNSVLYRDLEDELARLYNRESALVFNSGYHLNIGLLPALAGKKDLILADKLCHASLIDGMRLSRAEVTRFRHNDYEQLTALLKNKRNDYEQVFLVTESVFSMDGDCADLPRLVALKKEHKAVLMVDEAHGVGALGPRGLGLAEEQGVIRDIDLLIGTCGKAWGGQGAFVCCSRVVADYLINTARSLIFTTSLPPVCLHWLLFVLQRLPNMDRERHELARLSEELRRSLTQKGLQTGGATHIVPVFIGDSAKTVQVAERLRDRGYWVTGVRPPTVPEGTARLRLSLSAAMSGDDLAGLPEEVMAAIAGCEERC